MQCPYCFEDSKIAKTAIGSELVVRQRRCKNPACNSRFFTTETDVSLQEGRRLFEEVLKEQVNTIKELLNAE